MRSLPPPILQPLAVLLLGPDDRQAGLLEGLVERGAVAVALRVGEHAVAVEDERGQRLRRPRSRTPAPVPPTRTCGCGARPSPSRPSRTWRRRDGGSCLPGFASRYSRCASTKAIFSAVEMLTFAQPRAMRSANCASDRPVPPCRTIGIGCWATISVTRSRHEVGLGLVEPVRGPDRGREGVDAGGGDELARHLDRMDRARPRPSRRRPRRRSRSRSRPRPGRRSRSASATTSIVWRVFSTTSSSEPSKSTEFQPVSQARRDPRPVGAVVEVQRHRDGHVVGPGAPHRVERLRAERLHRLQRGLDDERRLEVGRGRQDGLEREVVDDVDGRDPVALREGAIEDLTHRHYRHRIGSPLVRPCPTISRRYRMPGAESTHERWTGPPDVGDCGSPSRAALCRAWARPRGRAAIAAALTVMALFVLPGVASAERDFAARFSTNIQGDVTGAGNTLLSCSPSEGQVCPTPATAWRAAARTAARTTTTSAP